MAAFTALVLGALVVGCGGGATASEMADPSSEVTPGPAPIDLLAPSEFETASFGLGCFWGAEARFGLVEGVLRTRVGYSGGSTMDPTYRDLGDHTETVQVDFDPSSVSYQELLSVFFAGHDCSLASAKRQYMSVVFYHDSEQERLARAAKAEIEAQRNVVVQTEILPAGPFYLAEDYHQKYALQQHEFLMRELSARYSEFSDLVDSTAAARLNGYAYGLGDTARLLSEIDGFGLSAHAEKDLLALVERHSSP